MSESNKRKRRRRKSKSLNKTIWVVVGIFAVLLIGAIALNMRDRDELVESNSVSSLTSDTNEETFEQFLENASIELLIKELDALADDSSLEFPVRFGRIDKKITIANTILALDGEPDQRMIAQRAKLDSLLLRFSICMENGIDPEHLPAEIGLYLDSVADAQDDELENKIRLARIMLDVNQLLISEAVITDNESQSLRSKVETLVAAVPNNFENANRLILLANALASRKASSQAGQSMLDSLSKSYAKSSNAEIRELFTDVEQASLKTGGNRLPEIVNLSPSSRGSAIDNLMTALNSIVDAPALDAEAIPMVFERLHDLLTYGENQKVKNVRTKLEAKNTPELNSIMQSRLKVLDRKLQMLVTPFDITGASEFDSGAAAFKIAAPKYRIIYVVNEKQYGGAVLKFDELLHALRSSIDAQQVEIAVIYLEGHKKTKAFNDLKKFATSTTQFRIWYADGSTTSGKGLIQRILPIKKIPHILVLDGNTNHVKLIDPAISDIVRLF